MPTNALHKRQPDRPASESSYHRVGDAGEGVAGYVSRGVEQIREITQGREGSAVLIALAAGFGLGLVLGGIMGGARRRPRGWRERIALEGLGQRLWERIEGIVPDVLAEHLPNR
jgi:hypothetical protein